MADSRAQDRQSEPGWDVSHVVGSVGVLVCGVILAPVLMLADWQGPRAYARRMWEAMQP